MSLPLNEIRLVDLKKSGYNAKESDPMKGEFVFDNPKYYLHLENGAIDKVTIAKEFGFIFKWGAKTPRDLTRLKWKGYDFLTMDDGIWPEPLPLDAEGHFVNFDAPAMKVPTDHYVKTRKKEIAKSERAAAAKKQEFRQAANELEPGSSMTEEEVNKILGL